MPLDPAKISAAAVNANLSQAEVARRAGISPQHLSLILSGRSGSRLSLDVVERIAEALGKPVEKLLA